MSDYLEMMKRSLRPLLVVSFIAAMSAAPALAQEFVEPRFEALEQQKAAVEQRRLDTIETQRRTNQLQSATATDPVAPALRDIELRREQERILLENRQQQALEQREQAVRQYTLPNRRIAPTSVLAIHDPERYALPKPPPGKFYARLDGRFVLVDATSELVEQVLPPAPGDPQNDLPRRPQPDLQPPAAISDD
ncbi:MAG: RcnB family protein [Hyphomonadaceae bacterium]